MLLAHEHQHNETMLQLLQMVDGYEPVRVDASVAAEPVADGPEMVARRGRRRTRSAPAPTASPTTTSAPATRSSWTAFEIDRTPVTNAAYAEFVAETGAEPPMYWERDGDGWVTTPVGPPRAARPRQPGGPRLLARGRRLRPLGRQAAADRVRVGGRRRAAPTASAPTSTSSPSAAPPAGAYARRRRGLRRGADARRRLGVDLVRLRRLPRLRGLPLPRVLRGLLRRRPTRCCAAAPGRPAAT